MVKKVDALMSTAIALNLVQPTQSVQKLATVVKSATSAWKAQEAQLKSTGDYIKAAESRYNGLGDAIKKQENVINLLKTKQSELKGNTQSTAEEYLKFQQKIDSAKTKLASMQAQQQRAKQAMDLQKSGVLSLSSAMKTQENLMMAHVEKLQSEGKQYNALKVNVDGLRDKYKSLQGILEKENELLRKVKDSSGDTSDAYKKQQTRVYELGTKIAETRTKIKELDSQLEKTPHGFLSGVSSKLDKLREKADTTSHFFAKAFGANLAANAVTGVWTTITAHISQAGEAVKAYNDKQQIMNATWNTLTGSASKGKAMVDVGNQLSKAYGQNISVVDELNQQFYHVFNAKAPTEQLTKSVLTMSDTLGLSAENTERLGTNFTHMMTSGRMQLGDFNMINDQLPMYAEHLLDYERKVQNNSKLTMQQLRDQMSAGKISAKDAEAVMNSLGKKYQSASENLMKTLPGMTRAISSQMPALLNKIYQPIANMKNPLIGNIDKWVNSPETSKAFSGIGSALKMQIQDITKAFGGNKLNVTAGLNGMLLDIQTGIDKLGATIIKHKSDIKDFLSSVKTGSVTSWKIFVQVLKDLEPVLKLVGGLAAKYPSQFAALASAGILANKAIAPLQLSFDLLGKSWKVLKFPSKVFTSIKTEGTTANKVVGVIGKGFSKMSDLAKAATSKVGSAFTKLGSGIKTAGTGIGKAVKWTASMSTKAASKAVTGLQNVAKTTGKAIAKGLKFTASIATKAAQLALTGLVKVAKTTATGLKVAFNFLKANPFIALSAAVLAVIAALVELYKHNAKFRAFVNGIIKAAQDFFKGVTKWFSQTWDNIKDGVSKSWKNTKKAFSDGFNNVTTATKNGYKNTVKFFNNLWSDTKDGVAKSWDNTKNVFSKGWDKTKSLTSEGYKATSKTFSNLWSDTKKGVSDSWNNTKSVFSSGWEKAKSLTHAGTDWVSNRWSKLKSDTSNVANAMKNSHNATFRGMYNTLNSYTQTWHDVMHGKWNKVGSDLKGVANGIRSTIHSVFNNMYNTLNSMTGGKLGQVLNTFKRVFGSVKSVVEGAASGVRHGAVSIARGVINPINTMLSGLRKGINWILGKVGAHGIGSFSIPLPRYARGTQGGVLRDQLAMVNDGKGAKYREMYRTPDGKIGMFPAVRNMIVPLQKGTEILDGENSAKLASALGLSKYAGGTGGWLSKIMNTADGIMEEADNIIKAPSKFLLGVLQKHLNISAKGIAGSIISSFPAKLANAGIGWIKKLFNNFIGSMSNPKGSGVERWRSAVIKGLAANHLSTSAAMVNKVLRQIQTESGGNPNARQPGSDPDGDGSGPALGLMQTKRSTFNAYKFKGHGNLFNGFDDILAGIAYAKARYGSSLYFLGRGHGYANGGIVQQHGMYEVAENNKPEMIIPLDSMKRSRAWELLSTVFSKFVGEDMSNTQSISSQQDVKDNERLNEVQAELSELKDTVKTLLQVATAQLSAIKDLQTDPIKKYRDQANDAKFRSMQSY